MKHWTKIMLGAALVTVVGCTPSEAPPPQLATPADTQPAPQPAKVAAQDMERSELAVSAPFVLTLDAPDNFTAPGVITITATIVAPRKIGASTTIALALPPGATLKSGNPEETLAYMPAGKTVRTFDIHVEQAPTRHAPIKVAVNMVHSKGKYGAHAVRSFPKPAQLTVKPSAVPKPPVARPGVGIAVPAGKRGAPKSR